MMKEMGKQVNKKTQLFPPLLQHKTTTKLK